MDNRLPSGLRFLLGLSGRRLLAAQWLGIGTLALLGGGWMLQDEWRQRESATERQQRLLQQIAVAQRQLDEAPVALIPPTPLAPAATTGACRALAGDAGAGAQPDVEGADGRTGVPGEPRRHIANDRRQG